jgi:drug/metabolite transporter (DMT)-like permease
MQTGSVTASRFTFDPTYAALALTTLLWSSNFVIGRAVRDDVSPATLNFLRWAIALAILVPATFGDLRAHRALLARNWKLIAMLGFTGIAAFQTLCYVALTMTTALTRSCCCRSRRSRSSRCHGWRSASG